MIDGKKRSRWQKLTGKVYSLAKFLTDMFKILPKCYARIRPSYGCEAIGVGLSWVAGSVTSRRTASAWTSTRHGCHPELSATAGQDDPDGRHC
jgi:hypothetical protein